MSTSTLLNKNQETKHRNSKKKIKRPGRVKKRKLIESGLKALKGKRKKKLKEKKSLLWPLMKSCTITVLQPILKKVPILGTN